MDNLPEKENAIAAIRISSVKQGLQGDSPEHQKEQIERFADSRNINIKKFFIFMESASKEKQPVQEAIDYCNKPENNIQLLIIKSIDRFTRGGSYLYDHLKRQLDRSGVRLIDIYGIIGEKQVNTLDHLDVEYDWSVYSPTKKTEILEAERAKDEMRDIMTRMIGAEIRYVRMGYRVRRSPFGYENERVDTPHGKRIILKPHPNESQWIISMFELRARGTVNDKEIVEKINSQGFKSRKNYKRDPKNRTKIIGQIGGKPLSLKQFWRYIKNPIYAGVNDEKWTKSQPVRGKFKGLITIEMFNKANKGKIIIAEESGILVIHRNKPPDYLAKKQVKNPKFPYKKYVLCPQCEKPLYGSASRGKLGKYYPAYHCNKRGHYFRVPSKEFNETIESFVSGLKITPEYVEELKEYVIDLWNKRQEETQKDDTQIETKIAQLKAQAKAVVEKIKFLTSEITIKYMEEDLIRIEGEIKQLEKGKSKQESKAIDMGIVMDNIGYFLEHLEDLIIGSEKPLKRAEYFGLIFDKTPTYEELVSGTPQLAPFIALKHQFTGTLVPNGAPGGIRTPDPPLKRRVLYQLSYGRKFVRGAFEGN